MVERNDEYEQYDIDAVAAVVSNPHGEFPTDILDAANKAVRKKWGKANIKDGVSRPVGMVEYTADEVVSVTVSAPSKL